MCEKTALKPRKHLRDKVLQKMVKWLRNLQFIVKTEKLDLRTYLREYNGPRRVELKGYRL